MSKIHTTETTATRSYNIIPSSARERLAHDMAIGRSPAPHTHTHRVTHTHTHIHKHTHIETNTRRHRHKHTHTHTHKGQKGT